MLGLHAEELLSRGIARTFQREGGGGGGGRHGHTVSKLEYSLDCHVGPHTCCRLFV